jgi:hypothetical protein
MDVGGYIEINEEGIGVPACCSVQSRWIWMKSDTIRCLIAYLASETGPTYMSSTSTWDRLGLTMLC